MRTVSAARLFTFTSLFCASAARAELVQINFGPDLREPDDGEITLTDQLEHLGIVFSTNHPGGVTWFGGDYGWSPAQYSIAGAPPVSKDNPNNEFDMTIRFTSLVDQVSIRGFDGGGDEDLLSLSAYGVDDNLLAQDLHISDFANPGHRVEVFADDISYVIVTAQSVGGHSLFLNNLRFNTVPSPSGSLLLASGLLCTRRRR